MQPVNLQSNNCQPNFRAKFLDTPALRKVTEWAIEEGKFDLLNDARKRIDYSAVKIRIHFDLGTNLDGYPIAIFRRYFPINNYPMEKLTEDDFQISRPITYQSKKMMSPLKFGFRKIIQMSTNVYRNQMFREIVIHPPKYSDA